MGEEGKTKQKRLEFVVRQAWIIKIKRELDQILASMEDPSDQATRDQVEEWLARSLRDVPVDERDVKLTILYRMAMLLQHKDITTFNQLMDGLRNWSTGVSPTLVKKLLLKFDWKLPFEFPESRAYKSQSEPKKSIIVNKGVKPSSVLEVRMETLESNNKALFDIVEDTLKQVGQKIADLQFKVQVIENKYEDLARVFQPTINTNYEDSIEFKLDDLHADVGRLADRVKKLLLHEHGADGKPLAPIDNYEA